MKAYNKIILAALAVASGAAMVSCDDDFDRPPVIVPVATYEANMAIADFKAEFWDQIKSGVVTVPVNADGDSIILGGTVVTTDAYGNVFQQLVLEDESGALNFSISMYDINEKYQYGQEIRVNVTGMMVGSYSGLMQMGALYNGGIGRMEEATFTTHAQVNGLPDKAAAEAFIADMTMADLVANATNQEFLQKYQSRFVRLSGVKFNGGGTLKWTDNPGQNGYTARTLTDAEGNSLDFRTSNRCTFASQILPAGTGNVVVLLGYYNNKWQLSMMNPETDCTDFDGTRSEPEGPTGDNIFAESFTSGKGDFVIENVTVPASMPDIWKHDSKYGYMIATAYDSSAKTNNASESWLISPVIDLVGQDKAYLSFEQALNFFASIDAAKTEATVSIREEGATKWTALTVPSWPTAMSWTFAPSGDIDISAYAGKKVQIGFRYTSTASKAGTWELKNVAIRPTGSPAPDQPVTPPAGDKGSKENPYTVSEAVALGNPAKTAWVTGFIVGSAADKTADSFTTATGEAASNTNIFIADAAGETDYTKCLAVQLPAAMRDALSLQKNPGNLGKKVSMLGSLEKYFGMAGLKNSTEYVLDGVSGGDTPVTPPAGDAIFSESFASGLGAFTMDNKTMPAEISYVWSHYTSPACAKASAYVSGTAYATDSYLISPVIDLTSATAPVMTFKHATNFFGDEASARAETSVCIRVEGSADWTVLTVPSYPATQGWTFADSGDISLSAYAGKKVQVAFRYTSTAAKAGTWEIQNLVVK